MKTNLSRTLLPLVAALAIAGCATAPEALPEPLGALPATFKDDGVQWTRTAAEPAAPGAWWTAFGDPALDALIERANGANTSVQAAAARLAQARALLTAADAERLPQLGGHSSFRRAKGARTFLRRVMVQLDSKVRAIRSEKRQTVPPLKQPDEGHPRPGVGRFAGRPQPVRVPHPIRITRTSITFVCVSPVRSRSPVASKKW